MRMKGLVTPDNHLIRHSPATTKLFPDEMNAPVPAFNDYKSKTVAENDGQAYFDAAIFSDAADILVGLDPSRLAPHATKLLSPPTVKERLQFAAGVRGLSNSVMLTYLSPDAVTAARLQMLVTLLEGLCAPLLDALLDCCEVAGVVGPLDQKGRTELEKSRGRLSSAFGFLARTGATFVGPVAPKLLAELEWASFDKIPQLRNAVSHFNLRLDTKTLPTKDLFTKLSLDDRQSDFAGVAAERMAQLFGLRSEAGKYLDYDNSSVVYEERVGQPLSQTSRRRALPEIREILTRVEKLGFSMLFGLLCAVSEQQRNGQLALGGCLECSEGNVCGLPGTDAECPFCGHTWTFQ